MVRRGVLFGAILLALPLAVGCQREIPYGQVEGVVTLDGKPLPDTEVVFLPDPDKKTFGKHSHAFTDKDGRFKIANDMGREGGSVGFHRVVVNDLLRPKKEDVARVRIPDETKGGGGLAGVIAPPTAASNPNERKGRFSEDYEDVLKTPFRDIEVKTGSQTIDLPLKSKLP